MYHHEGCASIYRSLSYPFRSLGSLSALLWLHHKVKLVNPNNKYFSLGNLIKFNIFSFKTNAIKFDVSLNLVIQLTWKLGFRMLDYKILNSAEGLNLQLDHTAVCWLQLTLTNLKLHNLTFIIRRSWTIICSRVS